MQKAFEPLVMEAVNRCRAYFGHRLAAFYLHGSIADGDAIVGVSDLDTFLVMEEELNHEVHNWLDKETARLQEKYRALVDGVHLTACSLEQLDQNAFAKFALRYRATLLSGRDVLKKLNIPFPDQRIAQSRLAFARQCFCDALAGKQPRNTGEIPANQWYASRKFARYFVIIEGAYYLMAKDDFYSFEKWKVMEGLRQHCAAFSDILDMTEQVLLDAEQARVLPQDYLKMIAPLVQWMFDQVEVDNRQC